MLRKSKHDKFILIFCGIFLLIGTIFFGVGLLEHISTQSFKSSAVQTECVITDIIRTRRLYSNDSDQRYNYDVYVTFTVDGVEYEGSLNEWHSGMHKGQKITVFYNPDNPWDFRTDSSLIPLIFIPFGILFTLIGAIPLIMVIRKHAARKKLLESGIRVMADITDIISSSYKLNHRRGKHIICERTNEKTGTIYRYKSPVIWSDPATIIEQRNITELPVYLDRNNERNYYVDISQLFENVVDLT